MIIITIVTIILLIVIINYFDSYFSSPPISFAYSSIFSILLRSFNISFPFCLPSVILLLPSSIRHHFSSLFRPSSSFSFPSSIITLLPTSIRHHFSPFFYPLSLSFLLPSIIILLPSSVHHHPSLFFHPLSPSIPLPSFIIPFPWYQYNSFTSKISQQMACTEVKIAQKRETGNSDRAWKYSIRCPFFFYDTFLFLYLCSYIIYIIL